MEFEKFLKNLPSEFDKELIEKAYNYAKKAHVFQRRAGSEPFVSHPFEVAKIVARFGLDEVCIMAALLHDVVEDTPRTFEEIKKEFGRKIAEIVMSLSKIEALSQDKEDRNVQALRRVLQASSKDIRVLLIKLCDRLHNMQTLGNLQVHKRERIATQTLQIYVPFAEKLGLYPVKWELEDICFKVLNPEMYYFIKKKVGLKRGAREQIIQKVAEELKEMFNSSEYKNILVFGRPKNFYSIYKKIKEKAKDFEEIYDLYALRIVCESTSQCYSILGYLHERFQVFPDGMKDYIATPKSNGYQALHTILYSKKISTPVEVQIKTKEMDSLSEYGVAAHWRYKNIAEDPQFDKKVSWIRQALHWEREHPDNHEFLKLLKFDFFEDEIFVFTPKNKLVSLPENASVLDFAYAIHTSIGNRAVGARVNGRKVSLDTRLRNGDIVEIVTAKQTSLSNDWLSFVKTPRAKIQIRKALKLKKTDSAQVVKSPLSFDGIKLHIVGLKDYKKVRIAGCCDFKQGDQIVGLIYSGKKGVVIHNASCKNAKFSIVSKKTLSWKSDKKKTAQLSIIIKDTHSSLSEVLSVFSQFHLNVDEIKTKSYNSDKIFVSVTFEEGPFIEDLKWTLKKLVVVEGVEEVKTLFQRLKSSL